MPSIEISSDLTPAEAQALTAAGFDPANYATLTLAGLGTAMGFETDAATGELLLVLVCKTALPYSVLPLPRSRIVTAQGQGLAGEAVRRILPVPPAVRFVVERAGLCEPAQEQLAAAVAQRDAAGAGPRPQIPPLPFLRGRGEGEPS